MVASWGDYNQLVKMVFATWQLVNHLIDQLINSSQLIMQAEDGPDGISNVVTGLKGIKVVFGCVSWLTRHLPS